MSANYERKMYKDYVKLQEAYDSLIMDYKDMSEKYKQSLYEKRLIRLREQTAIEENRKLLELILEREAKIKALSIENERLNSILNNDGTNSGTSTSKTPINKKKVIPNSREKTGRKKGGQVGHSQSKLEGFKDEEVTEIVEHVMEECPECHSKGLIKEREIIKDCLDYKVVVEKTRHLIFVYRCPDCGREIHIKIPNSLKEANQYGVQVQALALALINQANVSLNKVKKIISGFTNGEIELSEGYLCKLQQRTAKKTADFCEELRKVLITQPVINWDDTVIMVNKNRGCLRYYGTEKTALYKAHLHKDKAGLDEDNILSLLSDNTTVVHDHNKVNYNDDYIFRNAECNTHLLRDLKKVEDNLSHKWPALLAKLLTDTNDKRNELIDAGVTAFSADFTREFLNTFNKIILDADEENKSEDNRYYTADEKTLIGRLLEYKDEYLLWVMDFNIPFTNNLSERSLRGVKSKMKISGQFLNNDTAVAYAGIKSYIETCYRNGISEFYALQKLCNDEPLELSDVLSNTKDQ